MTELIFSTSLVNDKTGQPNIKLLDNLAKTFSRGDQVAVKLHMGEENNVTALTPQTAKVVVSALKLVGANPLLFDSPVVYRSRRDTPQGYLKLAHERGFTHDSVGCPIYISNDSIMLKGKKTDYHLCKMLADSDGVCFLTHVKGHPCTGFGASIKNIGMGAMSKETKGMIHNGGKPVYSGGCTECMTCVDMCPTSNIRISNGRPEFDCTFCTGCSNCSTVCEEGVISPALDYFENMLTEATALALPYFGKSFFINCLINITELCDCVANTGKQLCKDIGYVMGKEICAVEKASFELIKERAGRDIFMEHHHVSPLSHIRRLQALLDDPCEYSLTQLEQR